MREGCGAVREAMSAASRGTTMVMPAQTATSVTSAVRLRWHSPETATISTTHTSRYSA